MVGSTPATRANQDTDRDPSLPRSPVQQIGRPTLLPTSSAENPACICGPGFGVCATRAIVRQQTRSCAREIMRGCWRCTSHRDQPLCRRLPGRHAGRLAFGLPLFLIVVAFSALSVAFDELW